MPPSDNHLPVSDRHSIAIITLAEDMFREMRRELSPAFRVKLASDEEKIKGVPRQDIVLPECVWNQQHSRVGI